MTAGVNPAAWSNQFAFTYELGMYYNFTLEGPAFRPTGCKGIDMPISEYPYTNEMLGIIHQTPTMECERSTYAPEGESVADIFDEFADDHDVWAEAFLEAWARMQDVGYEESDLTIGPDNSWLGYYNLMDMGLPVFAILSEM